MMTAFVSSNLFLITLLPACCFAFGVLLSDVLRLHKIRRLALYGMAIPVGLCNRADDGEQLDGGRSRHA